VSIVEVKDVELPDTMQRAMARQAEAEREKRAKIIHAEGEFSASAQLSRAANVITASPGALQLRYLQTLSEIATERNSTILFPVPIDLIAPFLNMNGMNGATAPAHQGPMPPPEDTSAPSPTFEDMAAELDEESDLDDALPRRAPRPEE
jgi:hypothetical protein